VKPNPTRTLYRTQAGAYRAEAPKRQANAFYWACVAPTAVERPAGYSEPAADPLLALPRKRRDFLARQRAARAELDRRAAERAEYAALGLDAPTYIRSDALIRDGLVTGLYVYLKNTVRREHLPLSGLAVAEMNIRLRAVWEMAA
jgi:hypothetical protein